MTSEEFENLSAAYALGTLSGEELRQFEEYLRTASEEERREVQELKSTSAMLPLALERQAPPEGAREKMREKIRISAAAESSARSRRASLPSSSRAPRRPMSWTAMGALASLLAIVFVGVVLKLTGTIDSQKADLTTSAQRVSELAAQVTELKCELARKEELLKILASERIAITLMNGLKVDPVGFGKVIWDPEKRTAILQVSRLPLSPSNKDYQLWVIKGKTPMSAGVFAVSDTTASFFKIEGLAVADPKEISAFAVTLEPKGGVPAPTGDMYLAGSPTRL
ncbi:MAG TPA: anti-sigma factor [Bacteroidota bacterium]|nr:anti-sigma factor [Bacteroidota bacterium]